MYTTQSALLVLLAAVGVVQSNPGSVGQCPTVGSARQWADQSLKFGNFSGVWYEFALTKSALQPLADCVRNEYILDGDGFKFISSGVTEAGNPYRTSGNLYPNSFGGPHLTLDVDHSFAVPHHILDTDYKNYACIYSCAEFSVGRVTDIAVILGRYPYLTSDYAKKCYSIFKTINVDASRFTKTHQGHPCLYEKQKAF